MIRNKFDTHNELVIRRFGHGVKLLNPDQCQNASIQTNIQDMFNMPFHVYLMQTDSVMKKMSETGARTFNFLSTEDIVGKCVRQFAEKECAAVSMFNDRTVVDSRNFIIKDESYTRLDDFSFQTLSFKFPWFNSDNKIIGIFGYSIRTDGNWNGSLADSIMKLSQTGLLPGNTQEIYDGIITNDLFTLRENDVLRHLVRGRTAKEIAKILNISYRTVQHHIEHMKSKSHSNSKSELIDKFLSRF